MQFFTCSIPHNQNVTDLCTRPQRHVRGNRAILADFFLVVDAILARILQLNTHRRRRSIDIRRWRHCGPIIPHSHAAQLHEFRRLHARARVSQAQRRGSLDHAGQAREAGATATAAGQHRRGRVQNSERVLARIQRGQHLIDHRVGRRRHGVVRRLRLRRGQVVGDQHVGVLAHDHRRHAGGLQGHAGALVRHDVRVDGHAHALVQRNHRAVGCAHPGLAGDVGDQDGIGSHVWDSQW